MKNAGRYEAAATKFLSANDRKEMPSSIAILDAAERVDNLIFTIARDSRRLAENLARHAAALEEVNYDLTAPTLGSAAGDINENSGKLREARSALLTLIGVVHGSAAKKEFFQNLE